MEISEERIKKARNQDMWGFANQILYDLCQRNPKHDDDSVIIAKVWLIGRAYAAAIERRKPTKNITLVNSDAEQQDSSEDFYVKEVAPKIKSIGSELDERIRRISCYSRITEALLPQIVDTHWFLTNVFSDISGMNKRSLASKYLHFHVPNMFYIFDSRAYTRVGSITPKAKELKRDIRRCLCEKSCDESYLDFVAKAYILNEKIYNDENRKVWLTPRQLDSLLLNY